MSSLLQRNDFPQKKNFAVNRVDVRVQTYFLLALLKKFCLWLSNVAPKVDSKKSPYRED